MNAFDSDEDLGGVMEGEVRKGFVRKVYGILSVQLLITFAIAFPIQQMDRTWIMENYTLYRMAMLVSLLAVVGVGCCCVQTARTFPYNYAFLLVVTLCEAVIVGFVSAMYTTESVMIAVILTAGIFIGLTLFAIFSPYDFTGMGPYLMAALFGLSMTSLLCMFFPYSPTMHILLGGAGAILFSFYIVYDTQLIVGGKHKTHQFGVDDYAFAALNIYLDIINLFLYILSLFGERRD
mmetsp:Transcript_105359/g.198402  ORF Transcript_105359/g.198402 Transcript_105359/m.198402 type:complete len:235 (+) Transcript_105359:72-776(+)